MKRQVQLVRFASLLILVLLYARTADAQQITVVRAARMIDVVSGQIVNNAVVTAAASTTRPMTIFTGTLAFLT